MVCITRRPIILIPFAFKSATASSLAAGEIDMKVFIEDVGVFYCTDGGGDIRLKSGAAVAIAILRVIAEFAFR